MGKYKPKRKLSAGEKKLFNLQKKSTITRGTSKNSLDPDKLRDVGYTKKPESTIEKPPTLTGRVDQTKGAPAPKRTTFKPENQFNSYNPLDEEMNKKHLKAVPDKPVMDDKINTPTDINKFGGGKKVDKKTLKRMNKPENQFNSYNPLDEDRKTFDKYMKDARGKKAEEKLPLLRKATKVHKELPDEDKK